MGKKMNCWEFMKCGRGPEAEHVNEHNPCPAARCVSADGINGGINGGRICWAIAGIYAVRDRKGSFAGTSCNCYKCDFHRKVLSDEGLIKTGILK